MVDHSVLISIISTIGGIIVAALTMRQRNKIVSANRSKAPKDRLDTIFDGYESLIKRQQNDIERKSDQLDETRRIIDRLQDELNETKNLVAKQQRELEESREDNKELVQQLAKMREQYSSVK
jgi:gas vesicle protein